MTSRSDVAPGEQHRDAVEPEREAAVRRRPGREALEQESEAPPDLRLGNTEQLEDAALHGGIGDTDASRCRAPLPL